MTDHYTRKIMNMNTTDREHNEWCLFQQEKLRNEVSAFASILRGWRDALKEIEQFPQQDGKKNIEDEYRTMWQNSWEKSQSLVSPKTSASADNHELVSWLLDKQVTLRRELNQHVKEELPVMCKMLVPTHDSAMLDVFMKLDATWRESWNESHAMITPQE